MLRFGIDLGTAVSDQTLLLDTNGPAAGSPALGPARFSSGSSSIDWGSLLPQLDGFDGEQAELLAGFRASIALAPGETLPSWLSGIDLSQLVRLDGAAYLDLYSEVEDPRLGPGILPLAETADRLQLRGDAAPGLQFQRDGGAGALFEQFSQAVSQELEAIGNSLAQLGGPGACPAEWLAFVDRFIALVRDLSGRVDALPALPGWLPTQARDATGGLAEGLRSVVGQLDRFRSQVLSAEAFVGVVNGLFANADLSLRLRLLARPASDPGDCCDTPPSELRPRVCCAAGSERSPERHRQRRQPAGGSAGGPGTHRHPGGASARRCRPARRHRPGPGPLPEPERHGHRQPTAGAERGRTRSEPQRHRSRPLRGGGGDRAVLPEQVSFKAGEPLTLVLRLPEGTLRSGQSGTVSYLAPAGDLELSRDGGSTWQPFAAREASATRSNRPAAVSRLRCSCAMACRTCSCDAAVEASIWPPSAPATS